LGVAGGFYVYLDADKRASERALGLLQFCHLALRNTESENILAEQRRNLQEIQSTAGNIRALVDTLPPEEQRKAKEIVSKINVALQEQGKLVSDYAALNETATRAVREQTENLQKGLTTIGMQVLGLKSLPASLHDLAEQVHGLDGRMNAADNELAAADAKLAAIKSTLDTLVVRAESKCPSESVASASPKEKDGKEKDGKEKDGKEKDAPASNKLTTQAAPPPEPPKTTK
jgi:chromosome segregation ATPase